MIKPADAGVFLHTAQPIPAHGAGFFHALANTDTRNISIHRHFLFVI
ncbi:hypothetical protein CHCC20335_2727 [Bacillus paralicheniformis]|nr:hypothetical protein CHCC20335_2727 [Bacillus paralicheniformis]